ncbi:MAG: primosomal protein N', partial [Oscillibacter sp.]|nr:primosomal protein N' [Oscillibacter sp.]
MEQAGLVRREAGAKRRLGKQQRRIAELALPARDALASTKNAPARSEVVKFLASAGQAACSEVIYYTGVDMSLLRRMEKSGLLVFSEEERPPLPIADEADPAPLAELNAEQEAACQIIAPLLDRGSAQAVLLHGVTGSGKTQVYLRLVRQALDLGKTALVLVPEIALTPQLLRRFASCFGTQVAMLHSSLRLAERYDQWRRVRTGEARVVLGTRSAVFAPLKDLGLVILDEEQEGAYQSEQSPRYHARDAAKYLCARHGAVLVLGSATPSIETAWAAEQGVYRRAFLRSRYNRKSLPQVLIADLKEEVRAGNGGTIGSLLRRELSENLERGEQSILFLNRRGSSRMLICGECGHVPECPRCSVPMTYHSANRRLMCHYCGHSQRVLEKCPACGGWMKQVGAGTQKAEEELHALFPDAAVLRMDADTAGGNHEAILSRFEREKVPILLGTQMVAKGLDFENVTLVGVLLADQSLYVDHFRAAERTFNLLTQVVGRAGR